MQLVSRYFYPMIPFEGVKLVFHCHNKIVCWWFGKIKMRSLKPGSSSKWKAWEALGVSLRFFSGHSFSHLYNVGIIPVEP